MNTFSPRPFARDPRGPSETAALRDPPARGPSLPGNRSDKFTRGGRADTSATEAREAERYRIADLVRLYRRRRMSQAEAATALRENIADMQRWECGDASIPRAVRERMAALYGLDPKLIAADTETHLDDAEWAAVLAHRSARAEAERQAALATARDWPDLDKAARRRERGVPTPPDPITPTAPDVSGGGR